MHHRATCNRVPHSHKSFPSQLVDTFPIEIKFRFNLIRERGGPSPSPSSQKQKGWTRRGSPFFFSFPPPREFFPRVPSPPRILDSSRPFPPPSGSLIKRKLLAASCHLGMLGQRFPPLLPLEKSLNRNALNRITFEEPREGEKEGGRGRVAFPPEHPSSRAVHLETKRTNPNHFAYALPTYFSPSSPPLENRLRDSSSPSIVFSTLTLLNFRFVGN